MTTTDPERAVTSEGFDELLRAQLESEITIYPARTFYPSSIGHPCDRYIVWTFTKWEQRERYSAELQSIFDEGRLHQPSIYKRLEQLGFDVVTESDRPVQHRLGQAVISGRPDGRIIGFRGARYRPPIVLEAKSMSDYQWETIRTTLDLLASDTPSLKGYYAQGHIYAFLENTPRLAFALKNKQTGLIKFLPDELDYGYAESILQRVERLQPMVEQAIDPAPIPYQGRICGRCPFAGLCYPARSFGEGASVLQDPHLLEQLEERDRLHGAKAKYDELDKAVKARLKREGVKYAIAGDFVVEGQVIAKRAYTVDAHEEIRFDIRRVAQTPKEGDALSTHNAPAAAPRDEAPVRSTPESDEAPAAPADQPGLFS
jgi:hypothetical protein